jgi:type IV pilus assembly protein PilZ
MPKASVVPLPELDDSPAADRRRSPRADLLVRVDYQTVDEIFSDFARNINEGGMFVETDRPAVVGSQVSLQFRIPGSDQPVVSTGRVVRVEGDRAEGPPGMGIKFDDLDDRSRGLINELVRNLRSRPGSR